MITAFAILLTTPDGVKMTDGMELVMYAVGSSFGSVGKICIMACVISFAFATVICWYYYGMECWGYVFGKGTRLVFLPLFISFVFFGCFFESRFIVFIVDAFMAVITLLCISALIKNSDRIKALSERGGVIECNITRKYVGSIKGNVLRKAGKHREH